MKLPSINYLITSAKKSFLRFPLTIIASLIAVILGIYLIEFNKDITNIFPYINIMLCMSIGIPLFFCATIIANKKKFDRKNILIINVLVSVILIAIYFTFPNSESTHNTTLPYIKYGLYNITCHLLVSIIPFTFNKQLNGFWHYNKILFIRILTSILYSGFIYIGLIIALTALHLLFDVKIHEELYFEIWIVTIGFFNTWFFVSGIPSDFDHLDEIYDYPKGLKTFSQFVLLSLLGLYLIILYTYGTKILVTWDWPKGIVSYLIIFVSIIGILTFLLLHPYGFQKENIWIKKASKGYYFILIPLLLILFIAIFMRLNDYGITINRYSILMLGVWLSIVCLYTALGKTNIKFIPTSLAIVLILISFGPWGMFSVSEKSQVNRLKNILEKSKILVDGKIQNETIWAKDSLPNLYSNNELKNEGVLSDSLNNEVKSIVEYLDNHHGFSSIKDWYTQDIDSIVNIKKPNENNYSDYSEAEIYMKTMGLNDNWVHAADERPKINFTSDYNEIITTISGYDYLINFEKYVYNDSDKNISSFTLDNVEYKMEYSNKPKVSLTLKCKNEKINFALEELVKKLKKEFGNNPKPSLPISKMSLLGSTTKFEFKIELHTIEIETRKNGFYIKNVSGDLFIKRKN